MKIDEMWIESLVHQMTLDEKLGMIHGTGLFHTGGVPRLGIPELKMSDGPMGVRAEFADSEWISTGHGEDLVTYLPCGSAIASTWNPQMARLAGDVLGCEARGRGKDVILAPGINIKRSPLCGRNFEYMSEDPCLTAELAKAYVDGVQQNDVAACPKHFAANGQETERLWVDTLADERTLQEIYFPAFRAVVEGGAYTLMAAYNRLNGEHCCTSKKLLENVLRRQWHYDGTVISDWGGVHDTLAAAESSLDIEMDVKSDFDQYYMAQPLGQLVRSGDVSMELIDTKVRNILRLMMRLNLIGPGSKDRQRGAYNLPQHRQSALEIARESIILLKNEGNLLPLDRNAVKTVAVIGDNAVRMHSCGGGSAEIKALYEHTPLRGIAMLLGGGAEVRYAPGYVVPAKAEQSEELSWQAESTSGKADSPICREASSEERSAALDEALKLAQTADAVIFVGGLNHDFDSEGIDRQSMKLPYGQDEVLAALLAARPDTVVVMLAGSPVEMPWLASAHALVWSYYNGMEGGTALAEILFGEVNPSGKLAESFPQSVSQCPAHQLGEFGRPDTVHYRDGLMVGYRHYDTANTPLNFCFGHGLGYSSFEYSAMNVAHCAGQWNVSLNIRNTGTRCGREIVQLYVSPLHPHVVRPKHELKAFESVDLEPQEERRITFVLSKQALAYFNVECQEWVVDPGVYELQVGASSRDIRLSRRVEID
ncbi:MAG: beta-glucosidase [Aristaeellaceae bacterium]